jgi:hypothetical protein
MRASGTVTGHSHRSRKGGRKPTAKSGIAITPHPLAWVTAFELSGQERGRCFIVPGAVIVANSVKRPKWLPN